MAGGPDKIVDAAQLILDLDIFRLVNHSMGEDAGDEILQVVASRLAQALPTGSPAFRIGGNEFAIVLVDIHFDRGISGRNVQPLDSERCLIQLKTNSGKRHRCQYLTGMVVPFAAETAGKALFLSRKGRRFWLSMSFDKTLDVMDEGAVRQYAASLIETELENQVVGFDLGVERQVTDSAGTVYHLPDAAAASLNRLGKRRVRYQRRYARMARANDRKADTVKRSRTGGEKKMQYKLGRYSEKIGRCCAYLLVGHSKLGIASRTQAIS